jgi:serine/threonine-protein kinase
VLAATHLQLDRQVAIKLLHQHVLAQPKLVERFAREARMMARISNDNVARVLDVGTMGDGTPFMVMEYLEGQELSAWIRASGPLPIAAAVDLIVQVCAAVAEAHRLGIVHRDLKPSNLLLTWTGDKLPRIKVLDFGISKALSQKQTDSDLGLTGISAMLGSPLYMSPEQLTSARDVDGRTDIWSIGAILYEMLTGHEPFQAGTLPQLAFKIMHEAVPGVRALRPEVPEGVESIIRRCLEKQPDDRFQTASELALALLPFGSSSAARPSELAHLASQPYGRLPMSPSTIMGPTALDTGLGGAAEANDGKTLKPVGMPARATRSRATGILAVVAGIAMIGGLGLGLWFVRLQQGNSTPAPAGLAEHRDVTSLGQPSAAALDVPPPDVDADAAPAKTAARHGSHGRPWRGSPRVRVPKTELPPSTSARPAETGTQPGTELFESRH